MYDSNFLQAKFSQVLLNMYWEEFTFAWISIAIFSKARSLNLCVYVCVCVCVCVSAVCPADLLSPFSVVLDNLFSHCLPPSMIKRSWARILCSVLRQVLLAHKLYINLCWWKQVTQLMLQVFNDIPVCAYIKFFVVDLYGLLLCLEDLHIEKIQSWFDWSFLTEVGMLLETVGTQQ